MAAKPPIHTRRRSNNQRYGAGFTRPGANVFDEFPKKNCEPFELLGEGRGGLKELDASVFTDGADAGGALGLLGSAFSYSDILLNLRL